MIRRQVNNNHDRRGHAGLQMGGEIQQDLKSARGRTNRDECSWHMSVDSRRSDQDCARCDAAQNTCFGLRSTSRLTAQGAPKLRA